MQQVLIHQNLLKRFDLTSLKSNVDKLDIDKFKKCTKLFKQFEKYSRQTRC